MLYGGGVNEAEPIICKGLQDYITWLHYYEMSILALHLYFSKSSNSNSSIFIITIPIVL